MHRRLNYTLLAASTWLASPGSLSASQPCTMSIVTFSVEDYLGNAHNGFPGMNDLETMNEIAANFHQGAANQAPVMDLPQGCNSIVVTPRTSFQDNFATRNAMTDLRVGNGAHREESRFMLYAGHGTNGKLFLGQHPDYSYILPDQLNLGALVTGSGSGTMTPGNGGIRWFWANSCLAFHVPGSPSAHWNSAFKGVKAMLGYGSLTFDYLGSIDVFNQFWQSWAVDGYPLYLAFFVSQIKYNQLTSYAIGPNCVSAAGKDYCRESFQSTDFNSAASGADIYYSVDIPPAEYED